MRPRRILVRLPNWVGDAVMATPTLRAIRAAHPDAEISVEGRPTLRGLLEGLPSFDTFLPDPGAGVRAIRDRLGSLRERRFDLAVLLPDSPRAALGPFLAGIPRRVGYSRDPVRRVLLTDRLEHRRSGGRREPVSSIDRYLALARHLGCPDLGDHPELCVDPRSEANVHAVLTHHAVAANAEILLVTPGASFGASKLWPTEHFAAACDTLAEGRGMEVVIAPGPGESATARRIAEQMRADAIVLSGVDPSLADLKAWVERAALVLTNDTGPRHVAVALDRPVVVLMGPTHPAHTARHLARQRVLRHPVPCSPCQLKVCPIDHRCLAQLHPDRAVGAALDLLGGERSPAATDPSRTGNSSRQAAS